MNEYVCNIFKSISFRVDSFYRYKNATAMDTYTKTIYLVKKEII